MTRDIIAFTLMAALVLAGVVMGLYLRHNSRNRTLLRQAARSRAHRKGRRKA